MRTGYFAFHGEASPIYQTISKQFYEHEKCGLQLVQYVFFGHPWLAVKKKSAYKEILKIG